MADAPESLAAALAALQADLPKVAKGEEAKAGTYSYRYADLADVTHAIMPRLGALGLSFTARPTLTDTGAFVLAYELRHVGGDSIAGQYPLPTGGTPQALGSAITYGRRYCLCAVTGVAPDSDDDDGAAAQTAMVEDRSSRQRQRERAEHPEPAHDVRTDPAWLATVEQLITTATTLTELDAVAAQIREAESAGQVAKVDRERLWQMGEQRHAEIKGTSS